MTDRFVSHEQARAIYDRIGRWQDTRPLSERRALESLIERAAFERASAVVEFGCGTGHLAAELLRERLPDSAAYLGVDVSPRMVALAQTPSRRGACGRASSRRTGPYAWRPPTAPSTASSAPTSSTS